MSGQNEPESLPSSESGASPLQPADGEVNPVVAEVARLMQEIGDKLYLDYLLRNMT